MSCKKSLEKAIKIGQMIHHGFEPMFQFTSVESYKQIPAIDKSIEDDVDVFSVQFNHDATQVLAGGMNSTIRVINVEQSSRVLTLKPSKYILGMPMTCLRYIKGRPDSALGCSPSGHIYLCHPQREGFECIITEDNETYALDLSPDGMELATCGRDRNIRIYRYANSEYCEDTMMGGLIPKFFKTAVDEDMREMGHEMTIHAIKFHPDNSCEIVTAGWDNIVKMWDTRAKINPVWRISGPHVCSPDGLDVKGNEVFTASWRGKNALQIWDLRNPTLHNIPICSIPVIGKGWNCENGDTEYLYGVKAGENNSVVASGSGFFGIRVVNKVTHMPIGEIYTGSCVNAIDIGLGGRQIVAGLADGRIILSRMK